MSKFVFFVNAEKALLCLQDGATAHYTLENTSYFTGVHPEMVRYYCRLGLIPINRSATTGEITFDAEALHEIRRIEHYRRHLGVSRRALPLICELRREGERRQVELAFLGQE